jgi:murein DD-endopeptidase MepM/ murein hydrolase activator NlpD
VRQDYKAAPLLRSQRRRGASPKKLLVVAATVLLGVGFTVRFVDLAEGHIEADTTVSRQLPLPTPAAARPAAPMATDTSQPSTLPQTPPATAPVIAAIAVAQPAAATEAAAIAVTESAAPAELAAEPVDVETTAEQIAALTPPTAAAPADNAETPAASENPDVAAADAAHWAEHVVKKGDTLASIFKNMGLSPALLHRITHSSDEAAGLAKIRPGQTLRVQRDEQGEFVELELVRDRLTSLHIRALDEDGFETVEQRKDVERRVANASGVIESSLFVDGQKAGLSDGQIMELANIFGWDIDFALELRAGDQFSLVYEDLYLEGEKLRSGDILAAEFVNRGTTYRAIRYEAEDGTVAYYDPEGHSKRRAFIRTPVKFARISSGFTQNRWHPVLKKWRSHKGVDYAAPTGTPVKATGAGRVVFKGNKGGYGRVVMIEHAGRYTTVYGHLSRFAKKVSEGSRVKQGQVIGYVGQSGLATGPHLHYEFRVAGVHRNPLTVKLPKSLPLPEQQKKDFKRQAAPLLAQLDDVSRTLVANADQATGD